MLIILPIHNNECPVTLSNVLIKVTDANQELDKNNQCLPDDGTDSRICVE